MLHTGVQIRTVEIEGTKMYSIAAPYAKRTTMILRGIPGRRWWQPELQAWVCQISALTTEYLKTWFSFAEWDDGARGELEVLAPTRKAYPPDFRVEDFPFWTEPFPHQHAIFAATRNEKVHALFMEQRTGKTKIVIDTAAHLFTEGKIDGLLVITLNSVTSTWRDEFETHYPQRLSKPGGYTGHTFDSKKAGKFKQFISMVAELDDDKLGLPVLITNVEAYSHEHLVERIDEFTQYCRDLMVVVDESTTIANPTASRTLAIFKLGRKSKYRRILSGTPVKQNVFDLYAQFTFLDPAILGFNSLHMFKRYFADWEGYEILNFKNLEKLQAAIQPFYSRVLRKDVFPDLPEVVRIRRYVDLSPTQERLYTELSRRLVAEFEGGEINAPLVITRYMRLSQIVGGFVQLDDEKKPRAIKGVNPKLQELFSIIESESGKILIWAKFVAEIDMIADALKGKYGEGSVVTFSGKVSKKDRDEAKAKFQDQTSLVRFFVGQMETGGVGVDLDATGTIVYFSNSYKYEAREQSEARPLSHRQRHSIGIYDIVARGSVDELVLQALSMKKDLAAIIDKEHIQEWLTKYLC